jgi:hypothetical protein
MLRTLMGGAGAVAALLAFQASAQAPKQAGDEATLYSKGHFKGVRRTVYGPTRFDQPFVMKSAQIPEGSQWEFCSGNTYTGCRQYIQSVPATIMNVRSARPVAGILPATATMPGQSLPGGALAGGAGPSLRGFASEFFVAPDQGGNRVEVTPGTAEAMSRRAVEFCRAHGWRGSAHERLQTVGGRFYLADVLCAKDGG